MNPTHLLLMLSDGSRTAADRGEHGVAAVLDVMAASLAESMRHRDDIVPWREDDVRAIFEAAR